MSDDVTMAEPQGPPKTVTLGPNEHRSFGQWMLFALCTITSWIFCIPYLFTLITCAQITTLFTPRTKKNPNVKLAKEEKKLTRDIGYYVQLAGLELERHDLWTPDEFRLDLTRLRRPTDKASEKPQANSTGKKTSPDETEESKAAREFANAVDGDQKPRYPVLLLPGLMQHVGAYCTAGPDAMAFVFERAGYDVWLGNTRSTQGVKRKGHSGFCSKTWDWSIEEMALVDVPTLIEYVKNYTGASDVAVVGHSQGTAQMFLGLSKNGRPEVGEWVSTFSALAPAVYAGPAIDRWFLKILRCNALGFRLMMGDRSFLGIMQVLQHITPIHFYTHAAYNMFYFMLRWSDKQWDRHYRNRDFIFTPALVSSRLMAWWLAKGGFADTKCIFREGPTPTPWFDDQFPKTALYCCGQDNLCDWKPLVERMKAVESTVDCTVIELDGYSHMDVMWAHDQFSRVTLPVGKFIWDGVKDKSRWQAPSWTIENLQYIPRDSVAQV